MIHTFLYSGATSPDLRTSSRVRWAMVTDSGNDDDDNVLLNKEDYEELETDSW